MQGESFFTSTMWGVIPTMAFDDSHSGARCLVSSVSSDAHTWNLVFLELWLTEHGHHVTNLGSCAPDGTVLDACRTQRPDALVLSTVNGHGHLDGMRLVRALRRDPLLRELPVVIGGRLGVRGDGDRALHAQLTEAGFDAVLTGTDDDTALGRLDSFLHTAISGRARRSALAGRPGPL